MFSTKKNHDDFSGTNILHQVDRSEGARIVQQSTVPNKAHRVSNYMSSGQMGTVLTGHERAYQEPDPKSTIHSTGAIPAKDVWAPKAYQAHGNAGNQRFYLN